MTPEPLIRTVSDTAMWTAAYRADESDRPDALFHDSFARRLAGERGEEIARRVNSDATRYGVVIRTALIDELVMQAIRERGFDTVLNLAAGLDARPYRLDLPADLVWIEVDLPEIVAYKDEVLADATPRCRFGRVALDLADGEARRAFFAKTASRRERVLVLTEGLLGYLAPEDVGALATDLALHPQFAEWMTDLTGAQVLESVKDAAKDLKGGAAPILFAPKENTGFFLPFGWEERDFRDAFDEMVRLRRAGALGTVLHTVAPVLPRKVLASMHRALGVAVLGRAGR